MPPAFAPDRTDQALNERMRHRYVGDRLDLLDLDPEGPSDLLGDAHAAKVRIATLQRDDGGDEFRGRTLWAGFAARRRRGRSDRRK
jgi:hypothetical protein